MHWYFFFINHVLGDLSSNEHGLVVTEIIKDNPARKHTEYIHILIIILKSVCFSTIWKKTRVINMYAWF